MPSTTNDKPKVRAVVLSAGSKFASRNLLKNWKIVKPKPISAREVRITAIRVRSALNRVR